MPTYVYRREDGTTFEVFQRITDDALATDPETGQKVQRVIGSGAGLIFKGTGFYETDYVRKPGGDKDETKSDASKSDEGKTESKSESKTAETTSGSNDTAKKDD